jgi:senataxin
MEINTVDGFQGREVDILVLSTVRASNSSGDRHTGEARSIGFVADVRRMNVALTRARFSLWIVGNARTLQTNSHWASLVQNAKERNMFLSVQRPYGSIFEKVHGTTHSYHNSHLQQQKENEKAGTANSQAFHAKLHKEYVRHDDRTTEKEGTHLREDHSKRASRWDRKNPKAQDSAVQKCSQKNEPAMENEDTRATKGSLKQDTDQDSVMRKQGVEKKSLAKRLATGDPHDGSDVRRQRESHKHVKENVGRETDKALFKQGAPENSKVRVHNKDKKIANQSSDMGTIKGSSKHDSNFKSVAKKDDDSPSAHQDMQNLIQKAKGIRRFSEKPRLSNSNKEDSLLKRDVVSELSNKNSGTCPPTIPDTKKMTSKVKGARKFTEQPRSGSNQGDPSVTSHFDESSGHIRDLTKSQAPNRTSQNHQIAARKRQREDVESLLSSALISSNKPSSKCPKKKQK